MKLKNLVGIAGLAVFLASWIAVGVGYLLHVDKGTWVVLVVIAACASEGLFWCVAFMLGVGIVEARRKIWRALAKPFEDRRGKHGWTRKSPTSSLVRSPESAGVEGDQRRNSSTT